MTIVANPVIVNLYKHTSATDDFKENKQQTPISQTSVDEPLKIGQPKNQMAIDIEIIKLESKLLKELLSTKDALIKSKNANLETEMVIRSCLEAELLEMKQKLHCRGVIERFEMLKTSRFTGQPKMTRSAT